MSPTATPRVPLTVQQQLREPFAPEQIGKLPRITCGACRESRSKVCDRHQKSECATCKNWITNSHMHLDYVGHAAVTSRLLEVDPDWNWEPPSVEELERLPAAGPNGMWIKLTVNGVSRFGYGTVERSDADAIKILIGDSIRNAAMRFGVALDLWSKEDLAPGTHDSPDDAVRETIIGAGEPPRDWITEANAITDEAELLDLGRECSAAGQFKGEVKKALLARRTELQAQAATRAASSRAAAPAASTSDVEATG